MTPYHKVTPSGPMVQGIRDDIEAVANHLADMQAGGGKIARVAVTVTFHDGSSVAFEANRTPTP